MAKVRVEREYEEEVPPTVTNGNAPSQETPPTEADLQAEEDSKFSSLLQDPRLMVAIERDEPTEWNGIPCEGEVKKIKLPKTWSEIVDLVARQFGGQKYRMVVFNPRNGGVLTARQFEIQGDPILPDSTTPEERARAEIMFGKAQEKEENDPIARLERERAELERQIEVEKRQQDLQELKDRRVGKVPQADNRVADLERKIEMNKVEAKLEMIQRENELLRQQQQKAMAIVPSREGKSDIAILLEQMREDRRVSDGKFSQLLTQIQNDKMDAMAAKLDAALSSRAAAPGANVLRDQLQVIGDIGKMFGIKLKRGEDDEEDDEPKELWERLVDKYAPRLFDLFESKKKEGKVLTREEMIAEMKKIEDETVDNVKKRLIAEKKLPPVAVAPAPAPTGAVPPATPPTTPPAMSVQDEKIARAATVLAGLDRESELRPRVWEWTELCWRMMPEEYMEKICLAVDPVAMISVFDGLLDPGKLSELKAKISSNEKVLAWVGQGLEELKFWEEERKKDPKYDPFAEEEE